MEDGKNQRIKKSVLVKTGKMGKEIKKSMIENIVIIRKQQNSQTLKINIIYRRFTEEDNNSVKRRTGNLHEPKIYIIMTNWEHYNKLNLS